MRLSPFGGFSLSYPILPPRTTRNRAGLRRRSGRGGTGGKGASGGASACSTNSSTLQIRRAKPNSIAGVTDSVSCTRQKL